MTQITVSTLHKLIECDFDAGVLLWKIRDDALFSSSGAASYWNTKFAGRPALTSINHAGYKRGCVLGHHLLAHRVIWAMFSGSWPQDTVDHINGDRLDNRISNLREAESWQNKANAGKKTSSNRFIGVRPVSGCATFIATVGHKGKTVYVGSFRDEVEAAIERDKVAKRLKGDFARLNFPQEASL